MIKKCDRCGTLIENKSKAERVSDMMIINEYKNIVFGVDDWNELCRDCIIKMRGRIQREEGKREGVILGIRIMSYYMHNRDTFDFPPDFLLENAERVSEGIRIKEYPTVIEFEREFYSEL